MNTTQTTQTTETTEIDRLASALGSQNIILNRLLDRMDSMTERVINCEQNHLSATDRIDNLTERLLSCEQNHLDAMSEIEDKLTEMREFIGIDDADVSPQYPATFGDIETIHDHLDEAMEEIRTMMADPSFSDPTPSDEMWEHRASGQVFESKPDFLSDLDDAPPHGIERPELLFSEFDDAPVPIHEHDFDHLDRVERPELPFSEFDREPEPIHHDTEARVEPWYAEEGEPDIAVDRNGNWLRQGDTVQYAYDGALYLGCIHRMFAPSVWFVWVELAPTDARHRLTPVSIVPTEHLLWVDDESDEPTPYDEMF